MMLRLSAIGGAILLFLHGVLRLVDGLDGDHGPGIARTAGHALVLGAIVLFAVLAVVLRRLAVVTGPRRRGLADAAAAAALVGAACFLWVVTGDLWPWFAGTLPVPGALMLTGPVLFQAGLLVLLGLAVAAHRLPAWSPLLVLAGFVVLAVNLDLLPLGALLVLGGLLPLRHRPTDRSPAVAAPR